jgi:hypothetical protein
LLLAGLTLLTACKTTEERKRSKEASTIRFHLEVNPDGSDRNVGVPVYRARPMLVNVEQNSFLNEGDVDLAAVVPAVGGFMIKIQFNTHGSWVLDAVTTSNKGRRIVIFSQFGEGNSRWLAAPVIAQRVSNGLYLFTPDASYEEAERIVRGLNNIAAELRKES